MSRARKWALYTAAAVAVLLLAAVITGLLVFRSDWFREQVRARIIAEAERASGGQVSLESFGFDWRTLRAEVRGFVLRGTEPAGARPLARVAKITVGLRIVSVLRRDIDVASIAVERPEVAIRIGPDGRTNIPGPRVKSDRSAVEQILKLAVGRFDVRDGEFSIDSRRTPLNFSGRRLAASVVYEAAGPRYQGRVSLDVTAPLSAGVELAAALERNRVAFSRLSLAAGRSQAVFSGTLEDFKNPRLRFETNGTLRVEDAARFVRLPLSRVGEVRVAGKGAFAKPSGWSFDGTVEGRSLAVNAGGVRVANVHVKGRLAATPAALEMHDIRADVLDGEFQGTARLAEYRRLAVEGRVSGMPIPSLARVRVETSRIPWTGQVAGGVKLSSELVGAALRNTQVEAALAITPGDGPLPIEGNVALAWDQKTARLRFDNSRLSTPATTVDFNGTLGETLSANLRTTDFGELLAAASAVKENVPGDLPVKLQNGSATFHGSVTGALDQPRIQGRAVLESFVFEKRRFGRLEADFDVAQSFLRVASFTLERDAARLEGKCEFDLDNWRLAPAKNLDVTFRLRGGDLKMLLKEAGQDLPAAGTLAAQGRLRGTLEKPELAATADIANPAWAGQAFDRAHARLDYRPGLLDVAGGSLSRGKTVATFSGAYNHAENDIRTGELRFHAGGQRWPLAALPGLPASLQGLDAQASADVSGLLRVAKGEARIAELKGTAELAGITYEKRPAGALTAQAVMRGDKLGLALTGKLVGAEIRGSGEWQLAGDYPGAGRVEFTPLRMMALSRLVAPQTRLRFNGTLQGEARVSGPLRTPGKLAAELRLASLELRPAAREQVVPAVAKELILRNAGPIVVAVDSKGAHIRSARFEGRDTSLELAGTFAFGSKTPWNLTARGGLDLALFSSLYPEVTTSGKAVLNATVRGDLTQPMFGGRMEVQNASAFLTDVPTGLENVNGLLLFDRNRATIDHLTAQAGGGTLRLTGFLGIGGPELIYRLQAEAANVRIRYPEGVSTTVSGSVSLTGTSTRSLLAGTATVERASFNPRTDIGSLLAQSVKPVITPVPTNAALAGMQFDIRVNSSPTLELQTSLAKDIQAEADLRLRGSAAKPVVLGRVAVTQGEIQFFGNKYTITRGEIDFYNPARIEPVLNMDLETRVRGVTVNLAFTGPMSKLNMTYRSDPPLQSQEVIALLAVGREPGSNPTQAGAQSVSAQSALPSGADSLIGQVISTPISSRLQRFFGVSRLKIDPHLTGAEISPQARLTVEQQISRDITLTYVTNLSEAKGQLVRLEWDLSREWSVVAVRDENGIFGIDFQFKKRFR